MAVDGQHTEAHGVIPRRQGRQRQGEAFAVVSAHDRAPAVYRCTRAVEYGDSRDARSVDSVLGKAAA